MSEIKCDCCDNIAKYVFIECDDEKHFCEECAISHFGLYKMNHVKCDYCSKPCLEIHMKKIIIIISVQLNVL